MGRGHEYGGGLSDQGRGGVVCRNSEGVVMHCAVQSTLVDLGAKACQDTFFNLVGWKYQRLNLNMYRFCYC